MKKILLSLALIAFSFAYVAAQANLIKNSNCEEQGAWMVVNVDQDTGKIVPTFGSTVNTVLGGEGGNLEIKYVPTAGFTKGEVTIYQPVEVVMDEEYLFNGAMHDLSADVGNCYWIKYIWVGLEPIDGASPEENDLCAVHPWGAGYPGFNGTMDTAFNNESNVVTFPETGTIYIGINFGTCSDEGDFTIVFDELELIDQDAVSGINTRVADKGNTLSFYPNPASTRAILTYSVSENSDVKLTLVNILGSEVATLINDSKLQGTYTESFDCSNLANGIYYGVLKANNAIITKKIIVSK